MPRVNLDLRKSVLAKNVKVIKASYDTWTQWRKDKIGYWLFRIENNEIHAGFCKQDNVIEIMVTGTNGEAIYNTIVREGLVTSLQHAAYIGYELQKAEVALKLKIKYVQDKPLGL